MLVLLKREVVGLTLSFSTCYWMVVLFETCGYWFLPSTAKKFPTMLLFLRPHKEEFQPRMSRRTIYSKKWRRNDISFTTCCPSKKRRRNSRTFTTCWCQMIILFEPWFSLLEDEYKQSYLQFFLRIFGPSEARSSRIDIIFFCLLLDVCPLWNLDLLSSYLLFPSSWSYILEKCAFRHRFLLL